MPIGNILVTLILAGVVLWLVNQYVPMDSKIKSILNLVVVVLVIVWLLNSFGFMGSSMNFRMGAWQPMTAFASSLPLS